jgi:hypothetical protein
MRANTTLCACTINPDVLELIGCNVPAALLMTYINYLDMLPAWMVERLNVLGKEATSDEQGLDLAAL